MDKQLLLNKIKQAVQAIEPQAQIFLYGSRARNDAQPDSDWLQTTPFWQSVNKEAIML